MGVPVGYSSPFTLIDTSPKIIAGAKGDASVLKPTAIPAVPLIMDRIEKGVTDKIKKEKPLNRVIFQFGYEYKQKWIALGFQTPLINKIVFNKLRLLIGGRVRLIISGGAPLSAQTQEFIKLGFSVDMHQGYGLTESTASCSIADSKIIFLSYQCLD